MRCPYCLAQETRVVDSRLTADGNQIRRRRECQHCQIRFTSYETAELNHPHVIKTDNRRERFNEDKLRRGVLRATEKRPIPMEKVETMIAQIKYSLRSRGEREIASSMIGNLVMEKLLQLDQIAYVRFASVYRSFEDVHAFLDEIEKLEDNVSPEMEERRLKPLQIKGDSN